MLGFRLHWKRRRPDAYLMPEHAHISLSEPLEETLAEALKSLKHGVSRRLLGEAEHFW